MIIIALLATLLPAQEGPPAPQGPERIPVEKIEPRQDLETQRPGGDLFHLVPQRPLPRTPLSASSESFLHALFGFLPLESALPLEDGRIDVALRESVSSGRLAITTTDYFFRYDALLAETAFDVRFGLGDAWEFRACLDVSNLLEDEGDIVLARRGVALLAEADRSTGLGDLRLGVKRSLLVLDSEFILTAQAGVKLPLGREEDLLTSGGVDVGAALVATQWIGDLAIHLQAGFLWPGEPRVFEEHVEVRPAFTLGLALTYPFATWGLLAIQAQGHQSVFTGSDDSLPILDEAVVAVYGGARFRIGSYFLELGGGGGVGDQSSERIFSLSLVVPLQ